MKMNVAAFLMLLSSLTLGCGVATNSPPVGQNASASQPGPGPAPAQTDLPASVGADLPLAPSVPPGLELAARDDFGGQVEAIDADVVQAADDVNAFAFDLYAQLSAAEEGNLFFSPASISLAVALAYAGAEGATAQETAAALHFTLPPEKLHPALGDLQRRVQSAQAGSQVTIANRLWGRQGLTLVGGYLDLLRTHYAAPLEPLDFVGRPQQSCDAINAWVAEQTRDKIQNLIPSDAIRPDTQLVLTNAVYFKGDWYSQFDPAATQPAPFHVSAAESVDVPLMYVHGEYRCGVVDGVQMLDLPYSENKLSMLILLPQAADGLSALEGPLSAEQLAAWDAQLQINELHVYLPKFRLETSFELADVLQALGMQAAFDPAAADFSGITGARDTFLSKVFHKAYVDVHEEGTEAAAATGLIAVRGPAPTELREFRADHPFAFVIRDNATGLILFAGRLVAPPSAG